MSVISSVNSTGFFHQPAHPCGEVDLMKRIKILKLGQWWNPNGHVSGIVGGSLHRSEGTGVKTLECTVSSFNGSADWSVSQFSKTGSLMLRLNPAASRENLCWQLSETLKTGFPVIRLRARLIMTVKKTPIKTTLWTSNNSKT